MFSFTILDDATNRPKLRVFPRTTVRSNARPVLRLPHGAKEPETPPTSRHAQHSGPQQLFAWGLRARTKALANFPST
jgi:hypothetical protein